MLVPASAQEAAEAFGDGHGITVFAGGTILMPELSYGRRAPEPDRTLLLARAGLDTISGGDPLVIGAMVPVATLAEEGPEPLASAARGVADLEVRSQGTVGGNLCAPAGVESPRGDLQAPLIALGAMVHSTGAGGERADSAEDFLAQGGEGRLVLHLELRPATRAAYVSQKRRHAHTYTILSVAAAETADGVRVAAGGAGPQGARLPSVERALAGGAEPAEAARAALDDVEPADDALASAWYRRRVLPVLVTRALENLQGA